MPHDKTLYLVHCIDTEGPLYESLNATFERLETITGVRLEPSRSLLERIRRRELDLGGKEEVAATVVAAPLLAYNDSWDKIDAMLDEMMSPAYRQRYGDVDGEGWRYSWFVMDHVGYRDNPRRRDMGWHNIYDRYRERLREPGSEGDELHWHFHPAATYGEGHRNATSYLNSPHLLESLARRLLDRGDFPDCFRAGYHVERPDSHWFLEQWIPFDFSNQGMPSSAAEEAQNDLAGGRFGDWRRAPHDWSPYHPAHDDYQRPGDCRRVLFRCLNVGTRLRLLDDAEVRRAFARADRGQPTILAFTNHDFRDMRPDVAGVHERVTRIAAEFPEVRWRHAGARDAARATLGLSPDPDFRLEASFERLPGAVRLQLNSSADTFGPQPFLAVRSWDRRYLSDNLDIQTPFRSWSYTFDEQSIRPEAIEALAIASNDRRGSSCLLAFDSELRPTLEVTRS